MKHARIALLGASQPQEKKRTTGPARHELVQRANHCSGIVHWGGYT